VQVEVLTASSLKYVLEIDIPPSGVRSIRQNCRHDSRPDDRVKQFCEIPGMGHCRRTRQSQSRGEAPMAGRRQPMAWPKAGSLHRNIGSLVSIAALNPGNFATFAPTLRLLPIGVNSPAFHRTGPFLPADPGTRAAIPAAIPGWRIARARSVEPARTAGFSSPGCPGSNSRAGNAHGGLEGGRDHARWIQTPPPQ
jgi:hypothetical protein